MLLSPRNMVIHQSGRFHFYWQDWGEALYHPRSLSGQHPPPCGWITMWQITDSFKGWGLIHTHTMDENWVYLPTVCWTVWWIGVVRVSRSTFTFNSFSINVRLLWHPATYADFFADTFLSIARIIAEHNHIEDIGADLSYSRLVVSIPCIVWIRAESYPLKEHNILLLFKRNCNLMSYMRKLRIIRTNFLQLPQQQSST